MLPCSWVMMIRVIALVCFALPSFLALKLVSTKNDLIVGLNKYSHDASICILDSDGNILFTQSKERISLKKHDGGSVGDLITYGLEYLGASLEDIKLVVSNNHHFRVLPYERRIPFYKTLKYLPDDDYSNPANLLSSAKHLELSHHLAHAWSVAGTAPFDESIVIVMDGMGESYRAMIEDVSGAEENSGDYMHDLRLLRLLGADVAAGFVGQPRNLLMGCGYREAESAYIFSRGKGLGSVSPLFKRWTRERSPPELYNHGFENMESLGAVYSRISSHVLGDWNACGKIMGLAPWSGRHRNEAKDWLFRSSSQDSAKLGLGDEFFHKKKFMTGNPFVDPASPVGSGSAGSGAGFKVHWDVIESLGQGQEMVYGGSNSWNDAAFGYNANLAASVQRGLEDSATALVASLKALAASDTVTETHSRNVALVGGVALNSVLNGVIAREGGFDKVYVPPAPGDEGIAVGCAFYGLQRYLDDQAQGQDMTDSDKESSFSFVSSSGVKPTIEPRKNSEAEAGTVVVPRGSAYSGGSFSEDEIEDALAEFAPWIRIADRLDDPEALALRAADALARDGEVIAWFQGRSEFGQRALGARSILADPRDVDKRRFINEEVKGREWYRPLAPSVLSAHSRDWFEGVHPVCGDDAGDFSPYMSVTANIREDRLKAVPAVAHVDGSARLQTVTATANPLYHALIGAFFRLTGVPMVLNTSFNRKGQPIVETPADALRTFTTLGGKISSLFLGPWHIRYRAFPSLDQGLSDRVVFAAPLYIHEVTTGTSVLRVRVQSGRENTPGAWTDLPSALHLEILQILQPESSGEAEDEADAYPGDITVAEVFDAIQQLNGVAAGGGEDDPRTNLGTSADWREFEDSLRWLYSRNLVHFESTADGDFARAGSGDGAAASDELFQKDLLKIFEGTEIVDMRE